jgi:tripartite-type tricarboxylate transporter receptor subunit TctC
MANNTLVINPSLYKNLAFDVQKDFLPIAMVSSIPMLVVVHPSLTAKPIGELAEIAKKDPDGIAYATPGMGTPQHLTTELFRRQIRPEAAPRAISWHRTSRLRHDWRTRQTHVRDCRIRRTGREERKPARIGDHVRRTLIELSRYTDRR